MASELKYNSNITPETRKWTARVRVMEKANPRFGMRDGSQKYQRLILIDGQGTQVQATIFGKDIEKLSKTLYPLDHYYISNATVKHIQEQHRLVNNKYQWTISTQTPICEIPEQELNNKVIATPFNIVLLSDLQQHIDSHSQLDILAAVTDIYQPKTTNNGICQEILLIDHDLQPIVMTLRDDFVSIEGAHISQFLDSIPIILATRLRVTSFNGLSLSTRHSTTFIYNPAIPESEALRDWLNQHEATVKEATDDKNTKLATTAAQPRAPDVVAKIASLSTANKNASFLVKANASIQNENQKLWYMSCETCWNGINGDYNQKFNCRFCEQERIAQPRCRFSVELSDETATTTATLFGDNAEKLFGINALTMMQASNEEGIVDVSKLPTLTTPIEHYFRLKLSRKQEGRFIITNVKDNLEETESAHQSTQ